MSYLIQLKKYYVQGGFVYHHLSSIYKFRLSSKDLMGWKYCFVCLYDLFTFEFQPMLIEPISSDDGTPHQL